MLVNERQTRHILKLTPRAVTINLAPADVKAFTLHLGAFQKPLEAPALAEDTIDPTRIATELGWRPSVTLEEGLEKTVEWYLDNEDWWRALQDRAGVGARLGVKA